MKHSAKLIIAKGSRVLLVQRTKDGLWTLPGGKQRRFEKAKECIVREVMEELPKVRLQRIRRWKKFQRSTSKGKRRHVVYRARYKGGTLDVGDTSELVRAEWRYLDRTRLAPAAEMVTRKLFEHRE
jgi:8-oxo-dGTP pyrophosphatase MutT (NUDIX family)